MNNTTKSLAKDALTAEVQRINDQMNDAEDHVAVTEHQMTQLQAQLHARRERLAELRDRRAALIAALIELGDT